MADNNKAKGISYYRDWIYIILFALTVISFTGKVTLMSDQLQRNTKEIKDANLKVMIYKLNEIEKKVDKIIEIID